MEFKGRSHQSRRLPLLKLLHTSDATPEEDEGRLRHLSMETNEPQTFTANIAFVLFPWRNVLWGIRGIVSSVHFFRDGISNRNKVFLASQFSQVRLQQPKARKRTWYIMKEIVQDFLQNLLHREVHCRNHVLQCLIPLFSSSLICSGFLVSLLLQNKQLRRVIIYENRWVALFSPLFGLSLSSSIPVKVTKRFVRIPGHGVGDTRQISFTRSWENNTDILSKDGENEKTEKEKGTCGAYESVQTVFPCHIFFFLHMLRNQLNMPPVETTKQTHNLAISSIWDISSEGDVLSCWI